MADAKKISPLFGLKKVKSTVRKRNRNAHAATQRFVPIAEIHNDTVILKNGGIRAVLQVDALNFNLKSDVEQQSIMAGYEAFVNTLNFPLQIVMRSTRMNIDPYIVNLRSMAEQQGNDLLKQQTAAYADFVEKIVDLADIMQKRFYVIIPMDAEQQKRSILGSLFTWLKIDDSGSKASQRRKVFPQLGMKLRERVNLIQTGLNNIGLTSKRLNTADLIRLYYSIYNPSTSQEQKLPDVGLLNTDSMTL